MSNDESFFNQKYDNDFRAFAVDRFNIAPELVEDFMCSFQTNLHNVRFAYEAGRTYSDAKLTDIRNKLSWSERVMLTQLQDNEQRNIKLETLIREFIDIIDAVEIERTPSWVDINGHIKMALSILGEKNK